MFYSDSESSSSNPPRIIDMDDLLRDYDNTIIPPPTCWERIKAWFHKS